MVSSTIEHQTDGSQYQRSPMPIVPSTKDLQCLWFPVPKISNAYGSQYQRSPMPLVPSTKDLQCLWFPVPKISNAYGSQYQISPMPVVPSTIEHQCEWFLGTKISNAYCWQYQRSPIMLVFITNDHDLKHVQVIWAEIKGPKSIRKVIGTIIIVSYRCRRSSVTTLGDLLDFGQLFKAKPQLICPNLLHS